MEQIQEEVSVMIPTFCREELYDRYQQKNMEIDSRCKVIYDVEFEDYLRKTFKCDYYELVYSDPPTTTPSSVKKTAKRTINPLLVLTTLLIDGLLLAFICFFLSLTPNQRYWLILDNIWITVLIAPFLIPAFLINFRFYSKLKEE